MSDANGPLYINGWDLSGHLSEEALKAYEERLKVLVKLQRFGYVDMRLPLLRREGPRLNRPYRTKKED